MLTQSRLLELFRYSDGKLYRNVSRGRRAKEGDRAGYQRLDGYRVVKVDKKQQQEHRVIFLMHHGYLPLEIDHIDRDHSNNTICNLRAATPSHNQHNKGTGSNNISGIKGVSWNKERGKWRVQICVEGKVIYIGDYDDLVLAKSEIEEARKNIHGEFCCHG